MNKLSDIFNEVKREAEGLAERIEKAERFIVAMPGRIEAEITRPYVDPHAGKAGEFSLAAWRVGKSWTLNCSLNDQGGIQEYKRLNDASIKMKVFALNLFPDLIDAMVTNQSDLLKQIKDANEAFDKFITAPDAKGGE